jgi:hypothetical protein
MKGKQAPYNIYNLLVVSTPLKNISQLGLLFPIYRNNTGLKPPTRYPPISTYDMPNPRYPARKLSFSS